MMNEKEINRKKPECFHNGEPKQFENDMASRDACYEAWTDLIKDNCPESDVPTQNEVMQVVSTFDDSCGSIGLDYDH
jgi:hypothetical protein